MALRGAAAVLPRTGVLGLALFSLAAALWVAPQSAGGPASRSWAAAPPRTAAAQQSGDVTVVLERLTPTVPAPGRTLQVSGRVVNGSEKRVSGLDVSLHASGVPLGSRSEISETVASASPIDRAGSVVPGTTRRVRGPLVEGQSAPFTIRVPLDRLGLSGFGVYAIGVSVTGTSGSDSAAGTLATVTTFLPWWPPDSGVVRTRLALLWPLVGSPTRDAEDVFGSDTFGSNLARGGRLRALLDSGTGRNVTWMLDPELLEAVSTMADGYRVRAPDSPGTAPPSTPGGDTAGNDAGMPSTESPEPSPGSAGTVPGTYEDQARDWLDDARSTLGSAQVLALPYADPDLVALQRRGLETDLTLATTTGRLTVDKALGRTVTGDVIWPPDGQVNQATLEALRVAGARAVVLDGSALPPAEDLPYTPTGRARVPTIGGPMDAALIDDTLSNLFRAPSATPGSDLLARQRFLAETAMITAERPVDGRTVLAAPPRRWQPDPGFARSLLGALAQAPWVEQVTLEDLLAEPVPHVRRMGLRYDHDSRRDELPASHLLPVRTMRADLAEFASILAPRGGNATAPLDLAILRTESSAWRDSRREGRLLRERVRAELDARRSSVYVAADRLVTLTSKRGRFPVTIANDLDEPVDVDLVLTPRQRTRMTVRSPDLPRLDPHSKVTVDVPAEARANGVVLVDAQLRTRSGEPYGPPVPIAVRATDYGTIAYVITGGAFVVLFTAAGVRVVRRARGTRRRGRPGQAGPEQGGPQPEQKGGA